MKLRHSQQRVPFKHIGIDVWLILRFYGLLPCSIGMGYADTN